jgi:hypothetical protein
MDSVHRLRHTDIFSAVVVKTMMPETWQDPRMVAGEDDADILMHFVVIRTVHSIRSSAPPEQGTCPHATTHFSSQSNLPC